MQMVDPNRRYEYISFMGHGGMLPKKIRATLAHLHVALGHISNEKLIRMLHQNGAKSSVLEGVKGLDCQICKRVVPPSETRRKQPFNDQLSSTTGYAQIRSMCGARMVRGSQ